MWGYLAFGVPPTTLCAATGCFKLEVPNPKFETSSLRSVRVNRAPARPPPPPLTPPSQGGETVRGYLAFGVPPTITSSQFTSPFLTSDYKIRHHA